MSDEWLGRWEKKDITSLPRKCQVFIFDKTSSFVFLKFICKHVDEGTFTNKFNDAWDFHFLEMTIIYCFTSNFNVTVMVRSGFQEVKHRFCKSCSFLFHYVPHHCLTCDHYHSKLVHYTIRLHPSFQFFFHRWFSIDPILNSSSLKIGINMLMLQPKASMFFVWFLFYYRLNETFEILYSPHFKLSLEHNTCKGKN